MQKINSETGHKDATLQYREGIKPMSLNIVNTAIILTAGYLFKIILQSVTKSPVKRLLGNTLILGVANQAANNPETIRSFRKGFLKFFRKKPVCNVTAS